MNGRTNADEARDSLHTNEQRAPLDYELVYNSRSVVYELRVGFDDTLRIEIFLAVRVLVLEKLNCLICHEFVRLVLMLFQSFIERVLEEFEAQGPCYDGNSCSARLSP